MYDLIVLGIVPGTSFVITLWWALLFALIAAVLLLIYIEGSKATKNHTAAIKRGTANIEEVDIAGVLNPIFHIPGRNLLLSRNTKTK